MKKLSIIIFVMLFSSTNLKAQQLLIEKTNGTIIDVPINDIDSITFIENLTQFTCGVSIVSDVDGNEYHTVLIGEQCWMKENMRTTKDAAGNSINRRCYSDLTSYCYYYGGLYSWGAAMNGASSSNNVPSGVQGICPCGWHLPSKAEWEQLIAYLDAQGYPNNNVPEGAGNALKSCRQINSPFGAGCNTSEHPRWDAHATHNGFDAYGFAGLPGGGWFNWQYQSLGFSGGWHSTTESSGMGTWRFVLYNNAGYLGEDDYESYDYSIRCLRYDVESTYAPICAFTGSPTCGSDPLTVNFTDQSENNPTSWQWDFGDGNSSNQQNPSHTYQNYGNYTVSLMVSNSLGTDTETKTNYIIVIPGGLDSTDVYNPATGKIWMDRNLGASRVATSSTDSMAYGDLYQWGRLTDEHEKRTSGTTSTLSNSDVPGHGNFITVNSSPDDWRNPQNNNLWQGVSGTNNPCPLGYRLPTAAEWDAEILSWSSHDADGAFNSPLKLPLAGCRNESNGGLYYVGSGGNYWSAGVEGMRAIRLYFDSIYAWKLTSNRAAGYSVRCLKD